MLQSWCRSLTTKRFINFVFHNTRLNPMTLCDIWSLHYIYKYSVYVEYVSRELQDWLWVLDNLCNRQWNKCIQAVESLELVLQQQFSPTSQGYWENSNPGLPWKITCLSAAVRSLVFFGRWWEPCRPRSPNAAPPWRSWRRRVVMAAPPHPSPGTSWNPVGIRPAALSCPPQRNPPLSRGMLGLISSRRTERTRFVQIFCFCNNSEETSVQ